jgi:hypothetical protein
MIFYVSCQGMENSSSTEELKHHHTLGPEEEPFKLLQDEYKIFKE